MTAARTAGAAAVCKEMVSFYCFGTQLITAAVKSSENTLLVVNWLLLPRLFFVHVHVTGERVLTWSTWLTLHGVDVSVLCFNVTIGRGGRRPLPPLSSRDLGKFSVLKFSRLRFL